MWVVRGITWAAKNAKHIPKGVKKVKKLFKKPKKAKTVYCFVEGTEVSTDKGNVPIEEIKEGDKVWSENPETGEKSLKPVAQTFVNETDELIHLSVDGEIITTTPEHPFWVPKKGWTNAIDLRAGDMFVSLNGNLVILERVQHESLESPEVVYNFEVEDFHTYYVGKENILVHNDCYKKPVSGTGKAKATDVPSFARGYKPYVSENGKEFATRVMNSRYGKGNWSTKSKEYSKIKKWRDRGFK